MILFVILQALKKTAYRKHADFLSHYEFKSYQYAFYAYYIQKHE